MIAIDGDPNKLHSIWSGDERYDEVYAGDDRIWPDFTGGSGFVVQLPDADSLEYLYWLHAVDASETDIPAMWFEANGKRYYLNCAPNGKTMVRLDGDTVQLSSKQYEEIMPYLQDGVEIYVNVPERLSSSLYPVYKNDPSYSESKKWLLPLLPYTQIVARAHKGQKREWAYLNNINVSGLPSGKRYLTNTNYNDTGKGRHDFEGVWVISDVNPNDRLWEGSLNAYGAAGFITGAKQGLFAKYPAFSRTFKLNII